MQLAINLARDFHSRFGQNPRIFRAPGRVNLIGEHTDYNDGFVLPAAVGFSAYVAIAPRPDRTLHLHSDQFQNDLEFEIDHMPEQRIGTWCDYVLGVAHILRETGHELRGANLLIRSEVPIGSGLSSSAAIEVASAQAFLSLTDSHIALHELAKLCRRAENEFVGARVGIMDQFVSCMGKEGHALLLDCRSLEFSLVPIPQGARLVVCNTMVKHDLATGAYNRRREECEAGAKFFARIDPGVRALRDVSVDLLNRHKSELPEIVAKRCAHVIHENERTLAAAEAMKAGDLSELGSLMNASHRSLRDLYEVSCKELDAMVDAASNLPGFLGGRMMGGGFGGCTINLVQEDAAESFAAEISERYRQATGIAPQTYQCTAEDGAQEISLH